MDMGKKSWIGLMLYTLKFVCFLAVGGRDLENMDA